MKKYLTIIAAAAICLLTACSKEKELRAPAEVIAEESNPEFTHLPGWTYIGAGNGEVATAASIDDATAAFSWNTGDKIAIWAGDSYKVSAALDAAFDGSANAEFAFEGEDIDDSRADFAVYPASLVSGGSSASAHTAASLKITLPASYSLAEVQGEVSPTPMIAVNAPGASLAFKSICPLLRITVKNVAWDAEYIKVRFPGIKVHGEFELTDFVAGTSGIQASASADEDDETITITDLNLNGTYADSLIVNVPVPMGSYTDAVTSACDNSSLRINYIVTPIKVASGVPQAWTPSRKAARKITADLPVFSAYSTKNGEEYAHIENENRRTIVFAPGNLQACLDVCPQKTESWDASKNLGSASEWRFAAHQYDAIADSKPVGREDDNGVIWSYNSMENPQSGDWIDLFSWIGDEGSIATGSLPDSKKFGIAYHISSGSGGSYGNTTSGYSLYQDWGINEISYNGGSYSENVWHTPSSSEWSLILNRRYQGTSGYVGITTSAVRAKIILSETESICGLIIFPDNYSSPYGAPAIVKIHPGASTKWTVSDNQAKCSENEMTLAQWEKLEGAGCAFLPFTSTTQFSSAKTVLTDYVAEGAYWSSTASTKSGPFVVAMNDIDESAGHRRYNTSATNLSATYNGMNRAYGYGVRLTRWVKPE